MVISIKTTSGRCSLDQIQNLAAIAGLAHHFHPRQFFQQGANARAHERMVIGQDDANGFDGVVHGAFGSGGRGLPLQREPGVDFGALSREWT